MYVYFFTPLYVTSHHYNICNQNKIDKDTYLDLGEVEGNTEVRLNARTTKITSVGVNIGASSIPTGYKLIVEGDTKIQNGASKYFDGANNKTIHGKVSLYQKGM